MMKPSGILLLLFALAITLGLQTTEAAGETQQSITPLNVNAINPGPTERMYVKCTTGNEDDLLAFRRTLIANGAVRVHCFLPDIIVCDLPHGLDIHTIIETPTIRAYTTGEIASVSRPSNTHSTNATQTDGRYGLAWVKECFDRVEAVVQARARAHFEADLNENHQDPLHDHTTAMNDAPPWPYEPLALTVPRATLERSIDAAGDTQLDRNVLQNSEFMVGDILVNLIMPENTFYHTRDWTDRALADVVMGAMSALLTFPETIYHAPINFIFKSIRRAECRYDPILFNANNDGTWINDVIKRMGYGLDEDDPILVVHEFNNATRKHYRTDWVLTCFVANSAGAPDNLFRLARYIGYSYLGGPFLVMPYPAGDYNPWGLDQVTLFAGIFMREASRVFWGLYEYEPDDGSCSASSGYLNREHDNAVKGIDPILGEYDGCKRTVYDCIMILPEAMKLASHPVCHVTRDMMGLGDRNNNSVADVFESAPMVEFEHPEPETLLALDVSIPLKAKSTARLNRNPHQLPEERMNYAPTLKDATYWADGIGPLKLMPSDGRWDETEEECVISRPNLFPGYHEVSIQVRNAMGMTSARYKKTFFIFGLRYSPFDVTVENGAIDLSWEMIGETFGATFDLYRVEWNESGWDSSMALEDIQPSGPRSGNHLPFDYHDDDVAPGSRYSYFVKGTFSAEYGGGSHIFSYNSSPVDAQAMIPMVSGAIVSDPIPNPFNTETWISVSVPPTYSRSGDGNGFSIPVPTPVELEVFDVLGRKIKTVYSDQTFNDVITFSWDGTNSRNELVPTGIYLMKVRSGNFKEVKKITVMR